jgi:hypothetical protein
MLLYYSNYFWLNKNEIDSLFNKFGISNKGFLSNISLVFSNIKFINLITFLLPATI